MKGKLIKTDKGYILEGDNLPNPRRLSLKNCEVIENGYDLDELACDKIGIDISVVKHIDNKLESNSSPCVPLNEGGCLGAGLYHMVKGFEIGFQTALEILGDKKFSEEDIKEAFHQNPSQTNKPFKEFIQSLQQTEWQVEVIMECPIGCPHFKLNGEKSVCCGEKTPRLDSDGCVILKRL